MAHPDTTSHAAAQIPPTGQVDPGCTGAAAPVAHPAQPPSRGALNRAPLFQGYSSRGGLPLQGTPGQGTPSRPSGESCTGKTLGLGAPLWGAPPLPGALQLGAPPWRLPLLPEVTEGRGSPLNAASLAGGTGAQEGAPHKRAHSVTWDEQSGKGGGRGAGALEAAGVGAGVGAAVGAAAAAGLGAEQNGAGHQQFGQNGVGQNGMKADAFGQNGLDQDDYPGQDDGEEWAARDAGEEWRGEEGTESARKPGRGLSWAPGTKAGDVGATDSFGDTSGGGGRGAGMGMTGRRGTQMRTCGRQMPKWCKVCADPAPAPAPAPARAPAPAPAPAPALAPAPPPAPALGACTFCPPSLLPGVCAALFLKTKDAKQSFEHYKNALVFLLFTGLYFAVLYLQADSTTVQQVATSHAFLLPRYALLAPPTPSSCPRCAPLHPRRISSLSSHAKGQHGSAHSRVQQHRRAGLAPESLLRPGVRSGRPLLAPEHGNLFFP